MISDTEYTTIGEIANVKGGKRLKKGKVVQDEITDHPYIRVVDFCEDGLDSSKVKYITDEAYCDVIRYTINPDEIYISIAGTIGRVGIIPPSFSGANLTENAAKITDINHAFDKRFLMYYLRSEFGQAEISSKIVGTSQPKLALFRIKEIKVPRFSTPLQKKIAVILSAYDDLIENNRRRIKILEKMAQMIYWEWFVNFRFPGHQKVKMVDSPLGNIPDGWEVKKATDAIAINPLTKVLKEGEKPFVSMDGLSTDSMLISNIKIRSGNSGAKFKNGDTLFARITPCLENGKTAFVQFLSSDKDVAFGSTEFIVLRSKTLCPEFVYLMARSSNFRKNAIKSMSGASGRQRVQEACFEKYLFAHSNSETLLLFADRVGQIFHYIQILSEKNANLRQTRDILLPKLISGELDVSELDITIPEANP